MFFCTVLANEALRTALRVTDTPRKAVESALGYDKTGLSRICNDKIEIPLSRLEHLPEPARRRAGEVICRAFGVPYLPEDVEHWLGFLGTHVHPPSSQERG